jgi:hypothetical protein
MYLPPLTTRGGRGG